MPERCSGKFQLKKSTDFRYGQFLLMQWLFNGFFSSSSSSAKCPLFPRSIKGMDGCFPIALGRQSTRLVTKRQLSIPGKVGASFWWCDALLHQPVGIREKTLESGNLSVFSGSWISASVPPYFCGNSCHPNWPGNFYIHSLGFNGIDPLANRPPELVWLDLSKFSQWTYEYKYIVYINFKIS